jgi:endonuclease YncB( thermonuclease family)
MLIAPSSHSLIAAFLTLLMLGNANAQVGGTVSGTAKVLAGDILGIAGQVVILAGIRPPYPAQACKRNNKPWACGKQSARTLGDLTQGKTVRCRIVGRDNQSRVRAVCSTRDGELNARMVQSGMALASNNASSHYSTLQTAAKSARRGLWASKFIHPAEWRRGKRLPGMSAIHPELKGGVDDRVLVKSLAHHRTH